MHAEVNGTRYAYAFMHEPHFVPEWAPLNKSDPTPAERAANKEAFRQGNRIHGRTICFVALFEPDVNCLRHVGKQREASCTCRITQLAEGAALVSVKDNYCKEKGRSIALGRALKQLFPTRHDLQSEFRRQYDNRPRPKTVPKVKPAVTNWGRTDETA